MPHTPTHARRRRLGLLYSRGLTCIGICMLKIRRPRDRRIFSMEIPYLGKAGFISRRGPGNKTRIETGGFTIRLFKMLPGLY